MAINRFEYIVNTSNDFITLINSNYIYEIVNDSYCRQIDKKREEIINKSVAEVWGDERFHGSIKKHLDQCLSGQEVNYIDKFKFGSFEKYMHVSYYPYVENDKITHALVFSHDITKISEIESKLTNYEYRDPLTGLFNRRSLDIILEKEIEKAKLSKSEKLRALLFISLGNLAKVNQTYGHDIGDLLIENSGLRIKKVLRNCDFVFRFEGKELTAILTDISRNTDVARVAQKICDDVSMPYRHKGGDILITCKIGISIYPDDGEDKNTIIRNATAALVEAKRRGEKFVFYNRGLHKRAIERMNLESDMYKAFDKEQFELHYQPIVDSAGYILGAEALIRWYHPERGSIKPVNFIPIAEETGVIYSIGKWAIYTACKQVEKWISGKNTDQDIYVSVNLSAREFSNDNLIEIIKGALKNAGDLDPKHLKLEITESECMDNPEETIRKMLSLYNIGIELFIDDFGTGQSSLSYLKRIPAKTLKIDKVFVDELVKSDSEREYLSNIISLVRSRNKNVIIEGVSSKEQAELLYIMKCDRMQGFYFSKPISAEEFEKYLLCRKKLPDSI